MITLICTKCKATLEMDDAFAGGVCRCQYCGTIQTVPSHLKQASRGAAMGAGQKALYSTKAATGAGLPSSGLDELANVVASSGLASGLAERASTRDAGYQSPPAQPASSSKTYLMVGLGAVVAILAAVIVYLLVTRSSNTPVAQPGPVDNGPGPVDTPSQRRAAGETTTTTGPQFLDIAISGNKVVYLLDRGQSGRDVLDPLKAALYESLETLGADREFQVLFWTPPNSPDEKPDVNEFAYPKGAMAKANKDRIEQCINKFEDLTTSGRTDVGPVFDEALKRNPDVIFIATAKGINLDTSVVVKIRNSMGKKSVIVHTIDLTRSGDGEGPLKAIAQNSGGVYRHIEPSQLRGR